MAPFRTSAATDAVSLSTRERILAESLVLFAQQGFGGASIRELARRVGIRESSLYNHFPSKQAILEALVSEHGPASYVHWLENPRYRALADKPAAFCRQFAYDLVDQWADPREHLFQKVVTAERNRVPGIRAKYADQFYDREERLIAEYFKGFAAAGLITTVDPVEAAWLFSAGLIYLRLKHYVVGARLSPRSETLEAVDRYLGFYFVQFAIEEDEVSQRLIDDRGVRD